VQRLRVFFRRIVAFWRSGEKGKLGIGCGALGIVMLSCLSCLGCLMLATLIPTPEGTSRRPPEPVTVVVTATSEAASKRLPERVTVVVTATPEDMELPEPSLSAWGS
jgi:hypothetical protein